MFTATLKNKVKQRFLRPKFEYFFIRGWGLSQWNWVLGFIHWERKPYTEKYFLRSIMYFSLPHLRAACGDTAPHVLFCAQGWKGRGSSRHGFLWQWQTCRTAREIEQAHLKVLSGLHPLAKASYMTKLKVKRWGSILFPWRGWYLEAKQWVFAEQ